VLCVQEEGNPLIIYCFIVKLCMTFGVLLYFVWSSLGYAKAGDRLAE
jgi:hypothetical protein